MRIYDRFLYTARVPIQILMLLYIISEIKVNGTSTSTSATTKNSNDLSKVSAEFILKNFIDDDGTAQEYHMNGYVFNENNLTKARLMLPHATTKEEHKSTTTHPSGNRHKRSINNIPNKNKLKFEFNYMADKVAQKENPSRLVEKRATCRRNDRTTTYNSVKWEQSLMEVVETEPIKKNKSIQDSETKQDDDDIYADLPVSNYNKKVFKDVDNFLEKYKQQEQETLKRNVFKRSSTDVESQKQERTSKHDVSYNSGLVDKETRAIVNQAVLENVYFGEEKMRASVTDKILNSFDKTTFRDKRDSKETEETSTKILKLAYRHINTPERKVEHYMVTHNRLFGTMLTNSTKTTTVSTTPVTKKTKTAKINTVDYDQDDSYDNNTSYDYDRHDQDGTDYSDEPIKDEATETNENTERISGRSSYADKNNKKYTDCTRRKRSDIKDPYQQRMEFPSLAASYFEIPQKKIDLEPSETDETFQIGNNKLVNDAIEINDKSDKNKLNVNNITWGGDLKLKNNQVNVIKVNAVTGNPFGYDIDRIINNPDGFDVHGITVNPTRFGDNNNSVDKEEHTVKIQNNPVKYEVDSATNSLFGFEGFNNNNYDQKSKSKTVDGFGDANKFNRNSIPVGLEVNSMYNNLLGNEVNTKNKNLNAEVGMNKLNSNENDPTEKVMFDNTLSALIIQTFNNQRDAGEHFSVLNNKLYGMVKGDNSTNNSTDNSTDGSSDIPTGGGSYDNPTGGGSNDNPTGGGSNDNPTGGGSNDSSGDNSGGFPTGNLSDTPTGSSSNNSSDKPNNANCNSQKPEATTPPPPSPPPPPPPKEKSNGNGCEQPKTSGHETRHIVQAKDIINEGFGCKNKGHQDENISKGCKNKVSPPSPTTCVDQNMVQDIGTCRQKIPQCEQVKDIISINVCNGKINPEEANPCGEEDYSNATDNNQKESPAAHKIKDGKVESNQSNDEDHDNHKSEGHKNKDEKEESNQSNDEDHDNHKSEGHKNKGEKEESNQSNDEDHDNHKSEGHKNKGEKEESNQSNDEDHDNHKSEGHKNKGEKEESNQSNDEDHDNHKSEGHKNKGEKEESNQSNDEDHDNHKSEGHKNKGEKEESNQSNDEDHDNHKSEGHKNKDEKEESNQSNDEDHDNHKSEGHKNKDEKEESNQSNDEDHDNHHKSEGSRPCHKNNKSNSSGYKQKSFRLNHECEHKDQRNKCGYHQNKPSGCPNQLHEKNNVQYNQHKFSGLNGNTPENCKNENNHHKSSNEYPDQNKSPENHQNQPTNETDNSLEEFPQENSLGTSENHTHHKPSNEWSNKNKHPGCQQSLPAEQKNYTSYEFPVIRNKSSDKPYMNGLPPNVIYSRIKTFDISTLSTASPKVNKPKISVPCSQNRHNFGHKQNMEPNDERKCKTTPNVDINSDLISNMISSIQQLNKHPEIGDENLIGLQQDNNHKSTAREISSQNFDKSYTQVKSDDYLDNLNSRDENNELVDSKQKQDQINLNVFYMNKILDTVNELSSIKQNIQSGTLNKRYKDNQENFKYYSDPVDFESTGETRDDFKGKRSADKHKINQLQKVDKMLNRISGVFEKAKAEIQQNILNEKYDDDDEENIDHETRGRRSAFNTKNYRLNKVRFLPTLDSSDGVTKKNSEGNSINNSQVREKDEIPNNEIGAKLVSNKNEPTHMSYSYDDLVAALGKVLKWNLLNELRGKRHIYDAENINNNIVDYYDDLDLNKHYSNLEQPGVSGIKGVFDEREIREGGFYLNKANALDDYYNDVDDNEFLDKFQEPSLYGFRNVDSYSANAAREKERNHYMDRASALGAILNYKLSRQAKNVTNRKSNSLVGDREQRTNNLAVSYNDHGKSLERLYDRHKDRSRISTHPSENSYLSTGIPRVEAVERLFYKLNDLSKRSNLRSQESNEMKNNKIFVKKSGFNSDLYLDDTFSEEISHKKDTDLVKRSSNENKQSINSKRSCKGKKKKAVDKSISDTTTLIVTEKTSSENNNNDNKLVKFAASSKINKDKNIDESETKSQDAKKRSNANSECMKHVEQHERQMNSLIAEHLVGHLPKKVKDADPQASEEKVTETSVKRHRPASENIESNDSNKSQVLQKRDDCEKKKQKNVKEGTAKSDNDVKMHDLKMIQESPIGKLVKRNNLEMVKETEEENNENEASGDFSEQIQERDPNKFENNVNGNENEEDLQQVNDADATRSKKHISKKDKREEKQKLTKPDSSNQKLKEEIKDKRSANNHLKKESEHAENDKKKRCMKNDNTKEKQKNTDNDTQKLVKRSSKNKEPLTPKDKKRSNDNGSLKNKNNAISLNEVHDHKKRSDKREQKIEASQLIKGQLKENNSKLSSNKVAIKRSESLEKASSNNNQEQTSIKSPTTSSSNLSEPHTNSPSINENPVKSTENQKEKRLIPNKSKSNPTNLQKDPPQVVKRLVTVSQTNKKKQIKRQTITDEMIFNLRNAKQSLSKNPKRDFRSIIKRRDSKNDNNNDFLKERKRKLHDQERVAARGKIYGWRKLQTAKSRRKRFSQRKKKKQRKFKKDSKGFWNYVNNNMKPSERTQFDYGKYLIMLA